MVCPRFKVLRIPFKSCSSRATTSALWRIQSVITSARKCGFVKSSAAVHEKKNPDGKISVIVPGIEGKSAEILLDFNEYGTVCIVTGFVGRFYRIHSAENLRVTL